MLSGAQLGITVRASPAVVRDEAGALTGLVTLDDLPARYLQPQSG